MVQIIEENKAIDLIKRYFASLQETGYVSQGTMSKMVLYFFLLDFIDCIYPYLTEEDYRQINELMLTLFSGGGCLLPYPVFTNRCATLGKPYTLNTPSIRAIEITDNLRSTEDENMRRF